MVMEYALLIPVSWVRLDVEVSLIVAVTTPAVLASIVLAWATVAVPLFTWAATFIAVSIVVALIAVAMSAAEPVIEATDVALMVPVVFVSRVFRSDAVAALSVRVIALLPLKLLWAADPLAPVNVSASAIVPVNSLFSGGPSYVIDPVVF